MSHSAGANTALIASCGRQSTQTQHMDSPKTGPTTELKAFVYAEIALRQVPSLSSSIGASLINQLRTFHARPHQSWC
jgi:hypothetical protein